MNSLLNGSSLSAHRWLILGVFAGVLLAEALSKRVSPVLAWLAGGALIGLVPVATRSPGRILVTTVSTACVAALAHWLTTLWMP